MTFATVKEFLSDVSILHEKRIYLENNCLKIDKASPFRTIYIDGAEKGKKAVGDPYLQEAEIEYIEENCQAWILTQMENSVRRSAARTEEANKIKEVIQSVV